MSRRVHVCSEPGCPNLTPCPEHGRPQNAPWSADRDRARHMREARAYKAVQPFCGRCGATVDLDYHHGPRGPEILCNPCHQKVDPHARRRNDNGPHRAGR